MSVAISTAVTGADFDAVVEKAREVLKDNGFGVLTEIDMQATLKAKLGEDMERYLILGACNPPLAHRAVTAEKRIGVLLPCNVVVREDTEHPGTVLVEAMNPELMAQVLDNPAVAPIADEVSEKIRNVIDTLAGALRTT
ncbi:ABC transporter [Mycolicibacter heraklionensis]|nr:ABC transporter [Mycolicibacter heraklionensis]